MAQIIENRNGRRSIRLSTDDIISIVREYQSVTKCETHYEEVRKRLQKADFYIAEDL